MSVRRIYVEKKPEYAVAAKGLLEEIENFLGIQTVTNLRVLNRYDMEHISDATYEAAKGLIFSEPPVDLLFEGSFPRAEGSRVFSVEYLPGQFDQRADSAEQCVKLLNEKEEPIIRSATTYVIEGEISDGQFAAIQSLCINPVDSRLSDGGVPETLEDQFEEPADVKIFDGFCGMAEAPLKELYESLSLAMTFDDFKFIQHYFAEEEKRDPSMTCLLYTSRGIPECRSPSSRRADGGIPGAEDRCGYGGFSSRAERLCAHGRADGGRCQPAAGTDERTGGRAGTGGHAGRAGRADAASRGVCGGSGPRLLPCDEKRGRKRVWRRTTGRAWVRMGFKILNYDGKEKTYFRRKP